MNTKIIAALVALAAMLTYAETIQEPLVETHQGSTKKVVPDAVEAHQGSLKKPKAGVNCHHGTVKQAKEGAVETHQGSLKKPKAGVNCHHGSVKKAAETVDRDSNADRGGLSAPAPAVPKSK